MTFIPDTLRIMGFQLDFDGNYLFFISTNELICPEVKIGDGIINIYL